MATDCIAQVTFGFEPQKKPIVATFDMPHASSDGGAMLLKSCACGSSGGRRAELGT